MTDRLRPAVERNDPDELLRLIDGLTAAQEWEELHRLGVLCRDAVERGKQLWGVAEHVDYRLALEAPGPWAGPAVQAGAGRYTLGPLHEVAASTHDWGELAPHLAPGLPLTMTAHERVVRGDDLAEEPQVNAAVLEIPLRLEPWEPVYQLATFQSDRLDFPSPPLPEMGWFESDDARRMVDDDVAEALLGLVRPWSDESNGRAETVAVEGGAVEAIASLGARRGRIARVDPAEGLRWMAWAAADGGAHGRRRGTAVGRFEAWWTAAALAGIEWAPDPGQLGEAVGALEWYLWGDPAPDTGWSLRIAVADPGRRRAWALSALDAE
ncbi:MAG TPA: hypothetical protein VHM94_10615 [Acidimicrobiia bacterium]|nr:hypothetical protein [Acidimicrobiia bacterium]